MKTRSFALVVLFVALAGHVLASPILVRHDRDEAAYLELGRRYGAALCHVLGPRGTPLAEGTLIAPRWVLTAAHVARRVEPGTPLVIGGTSYTAERAFVHPQWDGPEHDVGLVQLTEPVVGVAPLPLYRGDDEVGREIVVFGVSDTLPPEQTAVGSGDGSADRRTPLEEAGIVDSLAAYLQDLAARDAFSGAVLLAKDGAVLFEQAYGLADREKNAPNRIDTKFNIGSMSKMFTALAVAQLAEQGKLSFDDPIIAHLPDYPNREVAGQVTIHHLLTHTSGLGFYPFDHGARTPADILPLFADEPPAFEPGSRMQYSNAGFVVLGLIIERVSGQSYYDYVRMHVFEPAGMTDTGSFAVDEAVPNRAVGYTQMGADGERLAGPRRPNTDFLEIRGSPAGGAYSTLRDMLRFGEALKNHTLLGPEHTEILLTGTVEMGPGLRYAYGFGDRRTGGYRIVGHNGGAPGVGADFKVYLGLGYTVVVFTNYDPRVVMEVSRELQRLLTR